MSDPTLCIYHGNCADGFSAAWAVWKKFPYIKFHEGFYGKPAPYVKDEHVLMVDFSYKAPVIEEMVDEAASVTILDHHVTARDDLLPLLEQEVIRGVFDMSKSGAVLAWNHFHDPEKLPELLKYVQDRDLWQFKLPDSREINACIFSYDYSFETWEYLEKTLATQIGRERMVIDGNAIMRKAFKDVEELVEFSSREMVIGGHKVYVANLPYTMSSDGAQILIGDRLFGATYFDTADHRVFSLRSHKNGANVAEIAKMYGGGGHVNAAGFQTDHYWNGDYDLPKPKGAE